MEQVNGFSLWYVADDNGPLLLLLEPNSKPVRNNEVRCWHGNGGKERSCYVNSSFLSVFFGILTPIVRRELSKYPTPKWEDSPVQIELSNVKIRYY